MSRLRDPERRPRGQMLVLFALFSTVIILGTGLVIDGGYALAQRRASQNASDFAALAGARVIAEWIGGDTTNGTDANVKAAITASIAINKGTALTFGAPNGPVYVNDAGAVVPSVGAAASYVGNGAIPTGAAGVKLSSTRTWKPYFLGLAGIGQWGSSADAVAKGGFSTAAPPPGSLFPAGISLAFFQTYPYCSGPIDTVNPSSPCYPQNLTPGNLNVPGGFGWLKFGCNGYGLGQVPPANAGGCGNDIPFLQTEIGPPSKSFGCCTQVKLPGSADLIGSLPGNKVSADCSYYVNNGVTVTVPIWDSAGGSGSNSYYHIVGFAGFQITGCSGGKNLEGVWRKEFWNGPTSATPADPSVPQMLGVQLVR
ncbi:MAG TPA: TadE/TadG family type IV pilus assembly protein [Candidatus Limnocylindrales bacterium]